MHRHVIHLTTMSSYDKRVSGAVTAMKPYFPLPEFVGTVHSRVVLAQKHNNRVDVGPAPARRQTGVQVPQSTTNLIRHEEGRRGRP